MINKTQCEQQGLMFEGSTAFPWDEESYGELKQKAKDIRKLGFRGVIAKSRFKELDGDDYLLYTLYVDPLYFEYREALACAKWFEEQRAYKLNQLMEEYKRKMMSFIMECEDKQGKMDAFYAKTGRNILEEFKKVRSK